MPGATALATMAPSMPGMGSSRSPQTSITIGFVGLLQRVPELLPEVSSAGIEVRLEADHDATVTDTGTSRDQGVQHFGGVMGVVVVDPDVVGRPDQLEPPVRALVAGELAAYVDAQRAPSQTATAYAAAAFRTL